MPHLLSVIMHLGLGIFTGGYALEGVDSYSGYCYKYGERPGDQAECLRWASKFHILTSVFLAVAFVVRYVLSVLANLAAANS